MRRRNIGRKQRVAKATGRVRERGGGVRVRAFISPSPISKEL